MRCLALPLVAAAIADLIYAAPAASTSASTASPTSSVSSTSAVSSASASSSVSASSSAASALASTGFNSSVPLPYTPSGGLDTNGSLPVYAPLSDFDYQSLNLALYQELIELDLFHHGLAQFSAEEFQAEGLNADDTFLIEYMADQEVGHATAIANMLGPKNASKSCEYSYPFETVREFLQFSEVVTRFGEAGVYGFLEHLNSRAAAQIVLEAITIEARQEMILRQFEGIFPMPYWFNPAITQSMQWTLMAPYIVGCPDENNRVEFQNFPALNITNNPNVTQLTANFTPAASRNETSFTTPGETIYLEWESPGKAFVAWISQLNTTYTPLTNISGNSGLTTQPNLTIYQHSEYTNGSTAPLINGTVFVLVTDDDLPITPANLTFLNEHVVAEQPNVSGVLLVLQDSACAIKHASGNETRWHTEKSFGSTYLKSAHDLIEPDEPKQGMQKADATTLASRPIKRLPRRGMAATLSALGSEKPRLVPPADTAIFSEHPRPPEATAPSSERMLPSKFFGNSSIEGTPMIPFSMAAVMPPSTPAAVPSSGSAFPFGTSASAATSSAAPAVSSSASQATKSFASFLGSGATNGTTTSDKSDKANDDDDALLKEEVDYLSHIRGLNLSLLSTVKNAIETDPFVDVGSLLETYKNLRLTEKKKFDEKVGGLKGSATKEVEKKSTTTSAVGPPPSMPKPVGGFSFGQSKPPGGSEATSTVAAAASPSEPFKWGGSTPAGSSSFVFGSSSSSTSSQASSSSPFIFGAGPSSSDKSTGFSSLGKGRPSTEDKSGDPPTSSGSSQPFSVSSSVSAPSIFGKSGDKDQSQDKDKVENKSSFPSSISGSSAVGGLFNVPAPSVSGSSLFGGSSTPTAFSTPTSFTTPEKPGSPGFTFSAGTPPPKFTMGAAPSPSKSSFGGFGKPPAVGSIGNPVGFGFGSPPKESGGDASSSSAPKPFVFGPPKDKPADSEDSGKSETGEGKGQEATGDEPPPLYTGSVHDREGEGEEDETTMHEIRSKVYKMVKDEDGQNKWADQGVGILRLKKHKETDARRVLLRNSSTGKVVINFRIYSAMSAKAEKNIVSFVGHENGTQATYRIRTKTEDQANDLKSALDREIEFVRAKSPSS
ncbi:hypothetical protein DAEQUDRAFT_736363 [Daedalea quercina L-15889]|uniref:RanBD1 domain-containing protein n=1 Tax=Daedalea quercina L-15889 TaxID=1314783 RepID=A0A165SMV3_9APHY|nr:hypothetical protein DAEQUDRAFT_736363 [Daedalea quercina L-15889]